MAKWSPITYYPMLDELTDTYARFSSNGTGSDFFAFEMPRTHWETMGRPGQVYFEPKPWPAADRG